MRKGCGWLLNKQWCAGQCFTRSSGDGWRRALVFADFHGVNTPTVAGFRLPM